ncbi:hypothetical protein WJX81_006420 [Elliptochloris bilobata]|uniref:Uncharacterized protein n=1 Tax=Elliptochloris bilobata TaxID=381761 RepID=A0AAW1QM29_9CHLO
MDDGEGRADALFPHWRPTPESTVLMDAPSWLALLRNRSPPLLLPGAAAAAPLPLLAAAATQAATEVGAASSGSAERAPGDAVFFVGGPVWALEWCPWPGAAEPAVQYLAVAAHVATRATNVVGQAVGGPALLQLWAVPRDGSGGGCLPWMALGLVFATGGVVWDAKWCPSAACALPATDGSLPRLGLLAVVLGSGAVQVPPVVALRPVAEATPGALGSSLPSSVEWLPLEPHDRLLAPCWDGSAAVWQLDAEAPGGAGTAQLYLLAHFRVDAAPLRAAVWVPRDAAEVMGCAGDAGRNLVVTGGHASLLKFWDIRDSEPVLELAGTMSWIVCAAWLAEPLGVVAGQDHGVLRYFDIGLADKYVKSPSNVIQGTNAGTIWSVHAREGLVPGTALVAYCGADGDVAVCSLPPENRDRQAHIPVAGVRQRVDVLAVLPDAALASEAGTFHPKKQGKDAKARVSDELEALHRVRWSWQPRRPPAALVHRKRDLGSKILAEEPGLALSEHAWLAHGGTAGIVRCHRRAATPAPPGR